MGLFEAVFTPADAPPAKRTMEDGREGEVVLMSYGKGRLNVNNDMYVDDCWCYESVSAANNALMKWNPLLDEEPTGWLRHPSSGRRRPGGDPGKEYTSI